MAARSSLALKYQPTRLDQTGVDAGTQEILRRMLRHASLKVMIYGDAGAGKTTLTRVLERLYYGDRVPSGAVHRINAHDDRTIGRQREDLYTFCRVHSPHKKLVIMDDAENVAPALHQALRCCVQEYGAAVMFVCTCSQLQRVARGLLARLLTLRTRHLSRGALCDLRDRVIHAERMNVSQAARQHILDASGVSARALLQHLTKLHIHGGDVDLVMAQECCSSVHPCHLNAFTAACTANDGGLSAAKVLYGLFDTGHSVMDILDAYFNHLKTSTAADKYRHQTIRLIGAAARSFYEDQDDEIVLAVFAKHMNALALRGGGSNEKILAEGSVA